MNIKRVIPCLDVDAGRVVKGTNFVDLRDAGDPVELAERYDAEGADELVFLDITATHEKRDTIVELARRTADNVFIPFHDRRGHPQRAGTTGRAGRQGADKEFGGELGGGGAAGVARRALGCVWRSISGVGGGRTHGRPTGREEPKPGRCSSPGV